MEGTIEKHTVTFQEHELQVDGSTLKERKEIATFVVEGEDEPYRTNLTHTRSIGDNYYKVLEVIEGQEVTEHSITTSCKDEEVEAFQQEWKEKWNPTVDEDTVAKAQELPKAYLPELPDMESVPINTVLLKQENEEEKLNSFEENKNEASAEHGSLYDTLHIQNKNRHDDIDHIYIEKDYHSGGKYIRELNPQTGKTVSFYYENSTGNVFFLRNEPEPKTKFYHNKKTGRRTTINMSTGERKTEYLNPEVKVSEEQGNEDNHSLLDPEMAQLEKEVAPLIDEMPEKNKQTTLKANTYWY